MLDRVALHQTRLRTPGISLDAKGIAIGAKGLVLLSSIDRLVGFLSLYTSTASLTDLLGSGASGASTFSIDVVRSKLGNREVVMSFAAEASDRLDRVAELARLSGGYTFTGTSRHFVQYRDAAAPFGYDVREIQPADAPITLYHSQFSQHYDYEKKLDLTALLLRLEPRLAPSSVDDEGPRWICAESGLGPALIHYFVRSLVEAEVGVAEWPPASAFDEAPVRRYLFRLEALPGRMAPLMRSTPGIGVYIPQGRSNAAVEVGYEHPINLRACPVFSEDGLVLIRGGRPPLVIEALPALGAVEAFARIQMLESPLGAGGRGGPVEAVNVPLRLTPDTDPWRNITATRVSATELGLLRQLAYRLGRRTLEQTQIAFTSQGAFLIREEGIESIPVGDFYRAVHPNIYVSAGYSPVPAVAPEVLHRAFGSPSDEIVFLDRDGTRLGVQRAAFGSLEDALIDAQSWQGTQHESVAASLTIEIPTVTLDSPGFRPLRDVETGDEG